MKKLSARRRHPLAALVVLILALAATGGLYAAFAPAPKAQADSSSQSLAIEEGKRLYTVGCATCHGMNGDGVPRMFPALAQAPDVQSVDPRNVLRVILEGAKSAVTDANPTGAAMPTFAWKLSDDQIAAVATYVRNSWSNAATAVSAADVASLRKKLAAGDQD